MIALWLQLLLAQTLCFTGKTVTQAFDVQSAKHGSLQPWSWTRKTKSCQVLCKTVRFNFAPKALPWAVKGAHCGCERYSFLFTIRMVFVDVSSQLVYVLEISGTYLHVLTFFATSVFPKGSTLCPWTSRDAIKTDLNGSTTEITHCPLLLDA